MAAFSFLTRLPVAIQPNERDLRQATAWFPLVGAVIGLLALLMWQAAQFLGPNAAGICTIIFTVLLTGALHEDALADACDGLGGGWSVKDKLRIMKDSQCGTYGICGLVLSLGLEWSLIIEILPTAPAAYVAAHALSRWSPVALLRHLPNVSLPDSRIHAYAAPTSFGLFAFSSLLSFVGVLWLIPQPGMMIAVVMFVTWAWSRLCRMHVGGITGDLAGAAVRLSYLGALATAL